MIAIHSAINISHNLSLSLSAWTADLSADSTNCFCVAPDLLCFEVLILFSEFFPDQRSFLELKFEYVDDNSGFAGVLLSSLWPLFRRQPRLGPRPRPFALAGEASRIRYLRPPASDYRASVSCQTHLGMRPHSHDRCLFIVPSLSHTKCMVTTTKDTINRHSNSLKDVLIFISCRNPFSERTVRWVDSFIPDHAFLPAGFKLINHSYSRYSTNNREVPTVVLLCCKCLLLW